eukprot:3068547-Pleurochrysis_carterae.AAC.2
MKRPQPSHVRTRHAIAARIFSHRALAAACVDRARDYVLAKRRLKSTRDVDALTTLWTHS